MAKKSTAAIKPRFLSKFRFKLALDCPTKLYYTGKKEYANRKDDDDFLQALADGGFQVGELAKLYYPGGIEISEKDPLSAVERTKELLRNEKIILFEAAIVFEDLLIRTDILVKDRKSIRLIEVKSKSYDPAVGFLNRSGYLSSEWVPYMYDIAFQKYVASSALPGFTVSAFLMLADKSKVATVDGLNQNFLLYTDDRGQRSVRTGKLRSLKQLGARILVEEPVDDLVNTIYNGTDLKESIVDGDFKAFVRKVAKSYREDQLIAKPVSAKCKGCEFHADEEEKQNGLKSGFEECWKRELRFKEKDFKKPSVLDIWNFRYKDRLIGMKKYFLEQVTLEDLLPKSPSKSEKAGMKVYERQHLQVKKASTGDQTPHVLINELGIELESWTYPYHFIDFETSRVAIPFHKCRRPYEQIAFQFSHHQVNRDGKIVHKSQWLQPRPGEFPNFHFVRELKKAIGDKGTVFRYSHHENTVLNEIHDQLLASAEPDKKELMQWIRTITNREEATRSMVDLCDLVKRFYYHPLTNGSNSIKAVLPAILQESKLLQKKYSKPVYGSASIPSLNFKSQRWISYDSQGQIQNPYSLLPSVFDGIDGDELENLISESDELREGGAAMTAYALMQYTEMSTTERHAIRAGLLRYCELDTLAMVMIWEHWKEVVG